MLFRMSSFACLFAQIFTAQFSFGAASIQGFMTSDGVTGRAGAPQHRWDREIVYVSPQGTGTGAGFRMLAMEPGWFLIKPPSGIAAGKYTFFTINLGNIDGGSTGFDIGPTIDVPGGSVEVTNQIFNTHAHYSVMYTRNYTDWAQEPWVWGSNFYQTFVATDTSITRIATKLADKNAGPGTHHLLLILGFSIYEANAGSPTTWKKISPTRTRTLLGTMDPIIHILDVNFLSNEVKLVKGQRYAVRYTVEPGSECTQFAMVARPDKNDGYPDGQAYVDNNPRPEWDLYGYVTNGAPDTVVNFSPTDQDKTNTGTFLGSSPRYGQTFVATGTGLAAVEMLYAVGCAPNPTIPIKISLYDGVGGKQIGPSKICMTVTDECQGRAAACWEKGEADIKPGTKYYVEFALQSHPDIKSFNIWSMSNNIPNVGAYKDGVSAGDADMTLTIAEYVSNESSSSIQTR